ncbi:MAG: response regulator [Candidatus Omnitrophica bacterium]|nr:response regulator [Candidatus Omnitrophota bacterium]MDD5237941.1 response regulator [Candidatus Omnitrophota bacterium]
MAKILIVDDEPDVVEFEKILLIKRNHEVFSATNISDAIKIIRSELPDIVLSDVKLDTDIAGLTIAEAAKKIKPEIVIYLITGLLDGEIEKRALKLGVMEILSKPIPNKVLEEKIEIAIPKK